MRMSIFFTLLTYICIHACGQQTEENENSISFSQSENAIAQDLIIDANGKTVETRVLVPKSYKRVEIAEETFPYYLRTLPLKPHGSIVKYYDGSSKTNYDIYVAVVDLEIGKKDLHQCADAVMRLRAEYLWNNKDFEKIHFNFTNGFRVDYKEWMKGKRVAVKGNKTWWTQSAQPSNTYKTFWKYMEMIFSYAGTYSLEKELKKAELDDLDIGDVFIQGGFPGHAVIVVDVAIDSKTGEKIFLLAQSYMPAQELQILVNPNNEKISPWYSVKFGEELKTPEWIFKKTDLKRFAE